MLLAFLRAPSGVASLVAIALILVVTIVAPIALTERAEKLDLAMQYQAPSLDSPLGTDPLGRDVLARVLVASRLSVGLSLGAVAIGSSVGLMIGLMTPFMGRRLRSVVLRAIDSCVAFPLLLIALFVSTVLGSGAFSAMVGIGLGISFGYARVSSALALTIGGRDFVLAARTLGISAPRRILRYVLPNVAESLLITTTVSISSAIAALSTLSFLGLGVQAPLYDWGGLLTEGVKGIYLAPAAALGPALAIMITALAFGFAGEALARATNPVLWSGSRGRGRGDAETSPVGPAGAQEAVTPTVASGRSAIHRGSPPILEVQDLIVSFAHGDRQLEAVGRTSFSIDRGERVGIVGESGSGKTMLAMAIADLLPASATVQGDVRIQGSLLRELAATERGRLLGKSVAVVFQDPMSSLNPALRVATQLMESAVANAGLSQREARRVALDRLREVRLPAPEHQMRRYPHELSGGMRQRVMIAMALMNRVPLLIADEPTTALDVTIQAQIMELLRTITTDRGISVIFISHNLALVRQFCDRVLVMYAGQVVEELPADQLGTDALHPYTRDLLAAVPDLSRPRHERFSFIQGSQPDLQSRPHGCAYQPRCKLALEKCVAVRPPLLERDCGRRVACWSVPGGKR